MTRPSFQVDSVTGKLKVEAKGPDLRADTSSHGPTGSFPKGHRHGPGQFA